jgi:superfamily II DNA or RNA helicase
LNGIHVVAGDYSKGELERAVMAADLSGDAVAEYRSHADHKPCVAFCVSIVHARATAELFEKSGYRAAAVHGELPVVERDRLIAGLGTGEIEVLTSCEILGEGVDIPTIGCAILLRPTRSLAVYLQQVGRGLRPAPGKSHLIVLDLAGNALEHGLPDEERHWTLAGAPKRKAAEPPLGWTGRHCDCLNQIGTALCVNCGAPRVVRPREVTVDPQAELIELQRQHEREVAKLSYRQFMSQRRSRREFEVYRCAHGYKKGWIWHAEQQQAAMFGGRS